MSDFISDLLKLKDSVDKQVGSMLFNYKVANPATFWINIDIADDDGRSGCSSDNPDFFAAVQEYMDAIAQVKPFGNYVNAELRAALTNGQSICLHRVGDWKFDEQQES